MTIKQRLLDKVEKQENGCWIFTGARNKDGYGNIKSRGKTYSAHRLSYELFLGSIPEGMSVLHRCDNCSCICPDHLFLGTQFDNVRDMIVKNRSNFDSRRLLTDEQVLEIRALICEDRYKLAEIGALFSIPGKYVWAIKNGVSYK